MDKAAIIQYKHFFQQLTEAMPWPVLIIDTSLHIFYRNKQAQKLLVSAEAAEARRLDQLLDDPAMLQTIQLSIQSGRTQSYEFEQVSSGDIWKMSISPIEHRESEGTERARASTYTYFAIVIEDLSKLRRLERARRDFVANISHELRTPLTSVRLLAETLEDVVETDANRALAFVEKIENEIQHLSDLVDELLELSRLESGRMPINIAPLQASNLVREIMARMLPQAQRHRVNLRTHIEQGQTMVLADSKQIARVLVNLVHNAIKFTPSGGTITIGTNLQKGEQFQCFYVSDTGIGIALEDLPRVFERFYKVNQARSRSNYIGPGGGGSGLGLAIAAHVVEVHGGQISATSKPGQGSTFTFTLPVDIPADRDA